MNARPILAGSWSSVVVALGDADGEPDGDVDSDALGLSLGFGVLLGAAKAGRFLGLAPCDAVADGLPEGLLDGSLDGSDSDGLALGSCVGAAPLPQGPGFWLLHATVRNRSCAVRVAVSTRELDVSPGTSTTMIWLPWVVTSASETPEPLTRSSMMLAASLRLSFDGLPSAIIVIRVPPLRSSPSAGFQVPAMATSP